MRILVLCDGGGPIGVGHVIRSLALAEASVAAGHSVVVAGHFEGAFVLRQLAAAPVEVVQLGSAAVAGPDPTLELIQRCEPDVLHVDSYDVAGWVMGSFVLSNMEDGSFGRRPADVVIDPTIGAELSPRPDDGSTVLLRGSRYTPVRQRARGMTGWSPPVPRWVWVGPSSAGVTSAGVTCAGVTSAGMRLPWTCSGGR